MKLSDKQIKLLKKNRIVVLATAGLNVQPRAILVELNEVNADRLVLTDNEMRLTKKNLLNNKKVFVLAHNHDYSECLKIAGVAKYFTAGDLFETTIALKENLQYKPKGVIEIKITKVV